MLLTIESYSFWRLHYPSVDAITFSKYYRAYLEDFGDDGRHRVLMKISQRTSGKQKESDRAGVLADSLFALYYPCFELFPQLFVNTTLIYK